MAPLLLLGMLMLYTLCGSSLALTTRWFVFVFLLDGVVVVVYGYRLLEVCVGRMDCVPSAGGLRLCRCVMGGTEQQQFVS